MVKKKKSLQCSECRNGEHENYTEDISLVYVRDSMKKKMDNGIILAKEGLVISYPPDLHNIRCSKDRSRMALYEHFGSQWLECPICKIKLYLDAQTVMLVKAWGGTS